MTPQEQKELAEWGAEWLEIRIFDFDEGRKFQVRKDYFPGIERDLENAQRLPWYIFESDIYAPILARLAKRKMEEMGWKWTHGSFWEGDSRYVCRMKSKEKETFEFHKNEYIALWLAIREAVQ